MDDGRSAIRVKPDDAFIVQAFASNKEAVIKLENSRDIAFVDLSLSVLREMSKQRPGASLTIEVNGAGFELLLDPLLQRPDSRIITVGIGTVAPATSASFNAASMKKGYKLLGNPLDFSLDIDGVQAESYSPLYTRRVLPLASPADPKTTTVVWVDNDQEFHFVPAVFATDGRAGRAIVYTPLNRAYAVVTSGHFFADLAGHWAQADIELLANKLIVDGASGASFAPEQQVTRGEAAALLVRSLGLHDNTSASPFADIPAEAWYAESIGMIQAAGIMDGFGKNVFRPEDFITREQLAVVMARALNFSGKLPQLSGIEVFTDRNSISAWASESVAILSQAGLIQGIPSGDFKPKEPATRAESAVMIRRLLQYLQWINS
ncbi:S-layer homology domain-containing protein [Paenibacillus sp. IHB B 3415]|uniref:S-layer homology domain-containing protein n=1 Tax=Paenibacillus sp. IHB B 3415 TaxID=867080 RepID=UPI00069C0D71|nr:S-layer homology domain-containing protein [Paenibacillus sp. IHB B 3415]